MDILAGLLLVASPEVLPFLLLGVVVGLAFGALPGLDATTGVALLLPVTYVFSPLAALVFFCALYIAGVFAGSITAILFRVPGSSEAIMTAIEGHQFTLRGESGRALGFAMVCSAIGGLIASAALFTVAPYLASIALKFGPTEYFALALLGLSCISAMTAENFAKGIFASLIGLFLATVGIDAITGGKRFDFGVSTLLSGVPFVPAIIGLFAASEVYRRIAVGDVAWRRTEGGGQPNLKLPRMIEFLRIRWTILRSSLLGLAVGILPGAGATTASILAYNLEVQASKDRSGFGTGKVEGIAAPESANNAAAVGAMIPLLALGIPGSGTTAVLMGAFLVHNLVPGPLLFVQQPDLVSGLLVGITLSNILILLFALLFVRLFARLMLVPYPILATGILSISVTGALAFGDTNMVMIMLCFAVLGMVLEALEYPLAPIVLGLVLGPIVETSLRRALLISDYDPWVFFERPISAALLAVAALFFVAPIVRAFRA